VPLFAPGFDAPLRVEPTRVIESAAAAHLGYRVR
jgi:hypothetical protein